MLLAPRFEIAKKGQYFNSRESCSSCFDKRVFFSRAGPPTVPELTVRYLQVKSGLSNATLRCHANGLDYNKLLFYHWQWRFQGHTIRKNDKYSMSDDIRPPNFCHHSKGSTILRITNTSKENLGQYVCELLMANISVAIKDILLGKKYISMLSLSQH